nr:hypothetical protein [Tanacetum cinerariifolium]
MSNSEDSTVTYTTVSSPYEGRSGDVSPGVDGPPVMPEDPYAYVVAAFQALPPPNYVPGPEEPEQAPPSPPLLAAASPTADSPGYIPEFDPDEDPEEDPADYPADHDNEEEEEKEPSGDDADEEDKEQDEDDDDEEEEHPASADSIPPPPALHSKADGNSESSIPFPTGYTPDKGSIRPTSCTSDKDLFGIYELLKKSKADGNSESSIPFPPGYTPDKGRVTQMVRPTSDTLQEMQGDHMKSASCTPRVFEEMENPDIYVQSVGKDGKQVRKEGGSILDALDDMIKVGNNYGF